MPRIAACFSRCGVAWPSVRIPSAASRSTSSARVSGLAGEGGLDELDGALGGRGRDALLAKTATARRRLRGSRQRVEPAVVLAANEVQRAPKEPAGDEGALGCQLAIDVGRRQPGGARRGWPAVPSGAPGPAPRAAARPPPARIAAGRRRAAVRRLVGREARAAPRADHQPGGWRLPFSPSHRPDPRSRRLRCRDGHGIEQAAAQGFARAGAVQWAASYPAEAVTCLRRELAAEPGAHGARPRGGNRADRAPRIVVEGNRDRGGARRRDAGGLWAKAAGRGRTRLHGRSILLPDASVDAVTVGQAFHWFRGREALAEIHRVLRPGGRLGLIWNFRDETVPWVAELTRIMEPHRGSAPRAAAGTWRGRSSAPRSSGPSRQPRSVTSTA